MSEKKSKRAAQLSPKDRRRQLLRCAISAFAANGLGRGTHAQVAKLAGVAVPTVFAYFPTREDLVYAVLGEIESNLLGIIRAELRREELTAFQKYQNLLSNYILAIEDDPDIIKVFLDWTTSFEASLAMKFQAYLEKLVDLLKTIVEEGQRKNEVSRDVNPVDAALMIYSSANVLAQIKFYNYGINDNHYVVSLINSVLHFNEKSSGASPNLIATNSTSNGSKKLAANSAETRAYWQAHINTWKGSGLSQTAYCAAHGLSRSVFSSWLKKLTAISKP